MAARNAAGSRKKQTPVSGSGVNPTIIDAARNGHDLRARYYAALNQIGVLSERYTIRPFYVDVAAATATMQLCFTRMLILTSALPTRGRRADRAYLLLEKALWSWKRFVEILEAGTVMDEYFERTTRRWREIAPLCVDTVRD